jgi:hypothetical protein
MAASASPPSTSGVGGSPNQSRTSVRIALVAEENVKAPKESLSQFFARVLDQLSITSWLPAVMLVAIVLVLSQLAKSDGSFREAFDSIGKMGAAAIVFLVISVVIAAMFAQAFEFEAIRAVEGYWPNRGPGGWLTRRRRNKKRKDRDDLQEDLVEIARKALESARAGLREKEGLGTGAYDALEAYVLNLPQLDSTDATDKAKAKRLVTTWKRHADPTAVNRLEDVERRLNEFPELQYRVLPTNLGNLVRAVEDRVHDPSEGRLENFAIHVLDQLPRSIVAAFREQRRRLDLYCGLVFVFAGSFLPAVAVSLSFPNSRVEAAVAIPLVLVLAALISYRAALASGRKFGLALMAIREHKDETGLRESAAPEPSAHSSDHGLSGTPVEQHYGLRDDTPGTPTSG